MEYFITTKLFLLKNPDHAWIVFGVFLMLLEIFFFSGIGLVFLSLGALTTGGLMYFHIVKISTLEYQIISFFIFTASWSILLWGRVRINYTAPSKNLAGRKARVGKKSLRKNKVGHVIIEGQKHRAKISPYSKSDIIDAAMEVWIHEVDGKTLLVGKSPQMTAKEL